jgi:hypothetical protein
LGHSVAQQCALVLNGVVHLHVSYILVAGISATEPELFPGRVDPRVGSGRVGSGPEN